MATSQQMPLRQGWDNPVFDTLEHFVKLISVRLVSFSWQCWTKLKENVLEAMNPWFQHYANNVETYISLKRNVHIYGYRNENDENHTKLYK